jgi:hypothetical protein
MAETGERLCWILRLSQQNWLFHYGAQERQALGENCPLNSAKSIPTDTHWATDETNPIEANPNHKTYQTAEALFPELGI